MSNGEEFEFFKRIEDLEEITKGLEATEATARENRVLLVVTFLLTFVALLTHSPKSTREAKDIIMSMLKDLGLSRQLLDVLEENMLKRCERFETLGRR